MTLPRLAVLALLALPATLAAQSASDSVYALIAEQSRTAFTIQGAGARATGTGGAFIAVADDATAVSYNPAGLAQLLRPEVSFTGQSYQRRQSMTGFASADPLDPTTQENAGQQDSAARPSFLSMAIPWQRGGLNTAVQFSYQRVLDFDFSQDGTYRATPTGGGAIQQINQNVLQDGGIDMYSVAVGAELSGRILAGASVNYWRGNWNFSSVSAKLVSGASTFDSNLAQANQFRGLNGNLGLIWRSQYLNLGLVYRTPFTATYTFENYLTQPDPVTRLIVTTHGARAPYSVHWPETLGWGLGVHPLPTLLLTADWARTPWSQANFAPAGSSYDNRNFFDLAVATQTPNVTTFHTGAEWAALVGDAWVLPVRAGWFKEPQPIVDPQTGQQRILTGWTAGFGVKYRSLTVDLAYKESRSSRYVSRLNADAPVGGVESYAYGTEQFNERRVLMSVIVQLDTEKVHKAVAWGFKGN